MQRILLLACAATALAGPLFTRNTVPAGWTMGPRAAGPETVEFMLALRQRNLDVLEKTFWEVSNPKHARYQEYMSISEIQALVAPEPQQRQAVVNWLRDAGVLPANILDLADALEVRTNVSVAEALFSTKFYSFTHTDGRTIVRSYGSYSVPSNMAGLVEMVVGVSTFPIPRLRRHKARQQSNAPDGVSVQTVSSFYGIPPLTTGSAPDTSQCVIEFEGQYFSPKDLQTFATQSKIKINGCDASHIIGPNQPSSPQIEANLDIQMIAGINVEATNWFWIEKGNGWLYVFATHFSSTQDVPSVNSISYGWWEGDQCTISPTECQQLGVNSLGYTARVNTEFQKIGLRGITLLSASGDSGCHGRTDEGCSAKAFRPDFPGASPYVLSVGGTMVTKGVALQNPPPICAAAGVTCAQSGTEVAVSYQVAGYTSGGGFSNVGDMPDFQKDVVANYLSIAPNLPPASYFNHSGRGFPDVSALGHQCIIVMDGQAETVGGTSCAAPIFGAVISLLNQDAQKKTGKPLGYVNQLLYQMAKDDPTTFHDITVGDNRCTESGCSPSCKGFYCTTGWDPITGLGTHNFPKMQAYIQSHL